MGIVRSEFAFLIGPASARKDQEAIRLLSVAAQEGDPVRRWIPLICCYTGARLNEICQLRKQDVEQLGNFFLTAIVTPSAGLLAIRRF
jgi:integrase